MFGTRPNHPGAVVDVSDNPLDASKLVIAFETGLVVVWDLRARAAEWRGYLGTGGPGDAVRAAAWQHDGKLMTAHADGALATWSMRSPRPTSLSYPHAKANKDGKPEPCKPILRLEWKTSRTGESLVIFSGGLPTDKAGRTHSITVLNGKSTTVLEMEHSVVDFVTLCESPHAADYQEPYAIVVLLQNDLVVIDLLTPGYPCFENPYPMDIHESPVTCCCYFADCPSDLIPAFYSVGRQGNKKVAGFSEKLWPINGGEWAPASCSYSEIILTGHADGSVKFWDASAGTLQILYKLKCSKVFERRSGYEEESPLAIQQAALCAESRRLCVALPHGHVVLFKFRKTEVHAETHVVEIPVISDSMEEETTSPEVENTRSASFSRGGESVEGEGRKAAAGALRVRGSAGAGATRRAAGFQAALVALQQGPPHPVTALTLNSSYGLMAWGGERGVVVLDVWRRCVLAALPAHALYLPHPEPLRHERHERRSPELDQLEESPASPEPAEEALPDPKLDARRKSTPWKTFNLKRQLSKVDLKLKAAFAPPENEETNEKGNSQFYCETSGTSEVVVESNTESPDGEETGEKKVEEDKSQLSSPLRVCSDVFERMHRELQEKRSSDVYDRMHKELQERWQDKERSETTPDISPSRLGDEEKATRPDNLPLFDEDGKPLRPPRSKAKKKEDLTRDQRDQRLLSVPNIKYNKQESVKDLRKKQATNQQSQSFAGNLMRRFREFVARLCTRIERNVEEETNEQVIEVPEIIGMDLQINGLQHTTNKGPTLPNTPD
ncbi:unnamed protein product [Euphydryas editha]|uniref:Lethal giant larvae homologue 2 domain-containing protein n=1 Tax=Euphydryas editha TaxID=104508 RepID=A0AAU9THT4_EUPED|nr:unnamed protein product [Euphydryas editha]